MKKLFLVYVLIIFTGLFCSSCQSPMFKWLKTEKNVQETKQNISKNKDNTVDAAKGYIYGANYSLKLDPNPNKYSEVAEKFTERATDVLGPPQLEEIIILKQIVNDLLSTNQSIIIRGEKELAEKDSQAINLQQENQELKEELTENEAKRDKVSFTNASLANKWVSIKRIFWWIVWAFIGITLLRIFSAIVPPPWNSVGFIVDYIFGGLIRGIFAILPKAKDTAKVVNQEYNTTLSHIVEAIQEVKNKDNDTFKKLEPYLKDVTNKEVSRPLIEKTKQNLGYI
ncbi:MAG: hypothetical protein AABY22_10310 [Nanoarchaeota archaeon]